MCTHPAALFVVASRRSKLETRGMERWRLRSLLALAASAIYLYGFPSTTIAYEILVLFHLAVGILLTVLVLPFLLRLLRVDAPLALVGWVLLAVGAVLGVVLIFIGTLSRLKPWLYAHIALCVVGSLFVLTAWLAWHHDSAARFPICRSGARHGCDCGRSLVVARNPVEEHQPHCESANARGFHGRRRRRPPGEILSEL